MPQPITGTRLSDRVFLLIDGGYCATPGSDENQTMYYYSKRGRLL